MRRVFQDELEQLGDRLTEMTALMSKAIENANEALKTANLELSQEVISADAKIDALQISLDEQAIELLALQNPVASDLRMIVGSLRMSASLERMGDLARHIAQLTRLRYPGKVIPEPLEYIFSEMAALDSAIAKNLRELLDTRELSLANKVIADNAKVDDLHATVFKAIAAEEWKESSATTVDVSLASRYYERFGDHGVSVANKVSYLVTGEWAPSLNIA